MPRLSRLLAVMAALLPFIALSGPLSAQTGKDVPAAIVNGKKIMRSDVLHAYETLPNSVKQHGLEAIYPRLLDRMIEQKLLVAEGRKKNMANDPAVKARMKEVEDAVIGDVYLNKLIEKNISPEYLQSEYKAFLAQNPPTEQVHARHILLKTEADAQNVIKHVEAGQDFQEAAKQYSTGPSASSGGDLGFFKRGDMVKPFSDAAFAMKPGEVSKVPVKTRFGWHVIQVVERRTVQPPTFEQVKPQLVKRISRNIAADVLQKLVDGAKVERFDLEGKPMAPEPAPAPAPQ